MCTTLFLSFWDALSSALVFAVFVGGAVCAGVVLISSTLVNVLHRFADCLWVSGTGCSG